MTAAPFKSCPFCGVRWETRDELIADHEVEFIGYQAFVQDGVLGLFMFNHQCGTTMAISAKSFADLRDRVYDLSVRPEEGAHSPYCLSAPSAGPCPEKCECAFVEEVIDEITR